MNEIYWHDRRTMNSNPIASPSPLAPRRRLYENTYPTTHYQPMNTRFDTPSAASRPLVSSYVQYPTASHQSSNRNSNFPYMSSLTGVHRRSSPTALLSTIRVHANEPRRLDPRADSHRSQSALPLSRSLSEDYYTRSTPDSHRWHERIYADEDDDDDDDNGSEIFNYTFDDTGVSFKLGDQLRRKMPIGTVRLLWRG